MSVSQIKKQFEELKTYLGRDVKGLEKLRQLKDPVNDLRVQLAAAEAAKSRAQDTAETLSNELIKLKAELVEAQHERHSLQQQISNLSRDLALTIKSTAEPEEETDPSTPNSTHAGRQYLAVLKELRKHLPCCPPPTSVIKTNADAESVYGYDRDSFAEGWSHQSLWLLGAAVAVVSSFMGEIRISSKQRTADFRGMDDATVDNFGKRTIQWFRKNINTEDESDLDDVGRLGLHGDQQQTVDALASRNGKY